MEIVEGFDFFPLKFDDRGQLQSRDEWNALIERAQAAEASDAIFIAHGFRNDEGEATRLYTNFLKTLRAHLSRPEFAEVAGRRFVVAGVFWPSKPFREAGDEERPGTRGLVQPSERLDDGEGAARRAEGRPRLCGPAQQTRQSDCPSAVPRAEHEGTG